MQLELDDGEPQPPPMAMHFRYNIYGNGTNIMMCKICHKGGDYTRDCQSREKRKLSRKDKMKKFSNILKSIT